MDAKQHNGRLRYGQKVRVIGLSTKNPEVLIVAHDNIGDVSNEKTLTRSLKAHLIWPQPLLAGFAVDDWVYHTGVSRKDTGKDLVSSQGTYEDYRATQGARGQVLGPHHETYKDGKPPQGLLVHSQAIAW